MIPVVFEPFIKEKKEEGGYYKISSGNDHVKKAHGQDEVQRLRKIRHTLVSILQKLLHYVPKTIPELRSIPVTANKKIRLR